MHAQIIPPLPVELMEKIITTAWHMPLSSTDRITFMRSSILLAAPPSQITHLELRYSFSAETPAWLVKSLQDKQEKKRNLGWALRSITDLSVVGAGASTVSDMLRSRALNIELGKHSNSWTPEYQFKPKVEWWKKPLLTPIQYSLHTPPKYFNVATT
ncbi:hypothetical protein DFH09DRAFT_1111361 [Mycena vulgaris]|nr:hypothetical protein DFH09DRAFT_1111361 [Mycena vulgaris]